MHKSLFSLLLLSTILVSACKNQNSYNLQGIWMIDQLQENNQNLDIDPNWIVYIKEGNKVKINLDVNACHSAYEISKKGMLSFGDFARTKMCCDNKKSEKLLTMLGDDFKVKAGDQKITLEGENSLISLVPYKDRNSKADLKYFSLRRGGCFGTCPIYSIKFYEDGTIDYNGDRFVKLTGKHELETPKTTWKELFDQGKKIEVTSMDHEYINEYISDLESVYLDYNGHKIKVKDRKKAPQELQEYITKIELVISTLGVVEK